MDKKGDGMNVLDLFCGCGGFSISSGSPKERLGVP